MVLDMAPVINIYISIFRHYTGRKERASRTSHVALIPVFGRIDVGDDYAFRNELEIRPYTIGMNAKI